MNVSNEVKELRLLFEISRLFDGGNEVGARLDEALALMSRHTGMARGSAALLAVGGRSVTARAAVGPPEEPGRPAVEVLLGQIIGSGRPMALSKLSGEPFLLKAGGVRDQKKEALAFIGVPVKIGDQTVGALSADRLFADSVSLDEDLRLLAILAALIAHAVEVRRKLADEAGKTPLAATLAKALDALEKRLITEALAEHQGNMSRAAQALGISERIMGLRMKKFGLNFREFRKKDAEHTRN